VTASLARLGNAWQAWLKFWSRKVWD